MKQYIPLKPVKRGIKVWVVAESSTGYFLDLQVYVGKEDSGREHGLGKRVVLDLTEHTEYFVITTFPHLDFSEHFLHTLSMHVALYAKIGRIFQLT